MMKSATKAPRTIFAKTDIVTPASGLFRLAEKGKSRLEAIEVTKEHDGYEITYTTPYRLGADDWQVFLVLCALAGLDKELMNGKTNFQLQLWDKFLAEGWAAKGDSLKIRTTAYAILTELGKSSGGAVYADLRESLKRLSMVFQTVKKGTKSASGSRLISYAFDEDSGELAVGISHHMAKAILGQTAQYVRISLVEMRALGNQAAVLLQAYFSARIRPGEFRNYKLDTLTGLVYGDGEVAPATQRKRRQRIKEALMSLHEWTTWQVTLSANNKVSVHRVTKEDLIKWEKEREIDLLSEFPSVEADLDD